MPNNSHKESCMIYLIDMQIVGLNAHAQEIPKQFFRVAEIRVQIEEGLFGGERIFDMTSRKTDVFGFLFESVSLFATVFCLLKSYPCLSACLLHRGKCRKKVEL